MKPVVALFNDGWADWEAGFVLGFLRDVFRIDVRVATPAGETAASIGGVRAAADLSFRAVDPAQVAAVLVIGSDAWAERPHPEVDELLRRAEAMGTPIGAICAATIVAARAGLLADRRHTSNSQAFLERCAPGYAGSQHYQKVARAVSDRGVVTASGSAPVTFAAEVFRLVAPGREADVAQFLVQHAAEHAAEHAETGRQQP